MTLVNAKILSGVFGLTETRIYQLAAREGMPRVARGQFDLISCIRWYVKYLRAKIEERSVKYCSEDTATQDQRVRRMRAVADLKEMEVASMKEQLMTLSDIRSGLSDVVLIVKARFRSLPARLSAEILGESSRLMIQAKIEKGIKDCLNQIADDGKNYPKMK
jgi:hypothetical protein